MDAYPVLCWFRPTLIVDPKALPPRHRPDGGCYLVARSLDVPAGKSEVTLCRSLMSMMRMNGVSTAVLALVFLANAMASGCSASCRLPPPTPLAFSAVIRGSAEVGRLGLRKVNAGSGGAGRPLIQRRPGSGRTLVMQGPMFEPLRRGSPFDNLPQRGAEGKTGHGYVSVMVVPTGVGAKIGGFAGDALPVARTMASVCDTLITHPNVVNGAMMYWPMENVLYTEGYALDMFGAGEWGLLPVQTGGHRIGLLLDRAMSDDLITRHLQVADAARATLGINVCDYIVTERPVNVSVAVAPSGASYGTIEDVDTLVDAAGRLIDEARCTAIAVVCRFPEDETEEEAELTKQYVSGGGMDPVGGAEAIISHLLTQKFRIPVAHAPANDVAAFPDKDVSPKAAAEELGFTFLPCVLAYLHRAPVIVESREDDLAGKAIWAQDVDSFVVPFTSAGGMACLSLGWQSDALVVAVEENETLMQASPEDLKMDHVKVRSYLEAIGVIAAHKLGVNPASLTPQVSRIRDLGSLPRRKAVIEPGGDEDDDGDDGDVAGTGD